MSISRFLTILLLICPQVKAYTAPEGQIANDQAARSQIGITVVPPVTHIQKPAQAKPVTQPDAGRSTSNIDVNTPDEDGTTPLMRAAASGKTQECIELISRGANVHGSDNGRIPLWWAAMFGHTHTCIALIEQGANVNDPNEWGATPLTIAATRGHTQTCIELIARGANVNARDNKKGSTPLMWASSFAELETCAALIALGADVTVLDKEGNDYLMVQNKVKPNWANNCTPPSQRTPPSQQN